MFSTCFPHFHMFSTKFSTFPHVFHMFSTFLGQFSTFPHFSGVSHILQTFTYVHIFINFHIFTYVHIFINFHIFTYVHIFINFHIFTYVHIFKYSRFLTFVYANICWYILFHKKVDFFLLLENFIFNIFFFKKFKQFKWILSDFILYSLM